MYCIQIKMSGNKLYLCKFDKDIGHPILSLNFSEANIYTDSEFAKTACKNCQLYHSEAKVVNA